MMVNNYQASSWSWQFSQFQQRITEWWEQLSTNAAQSIPDFIRPAWLAWLNAPWLQELVKILLWILLVLLVLRFILSLWQEFNPYFSWFLTGKRPVSSSTMTELALTRENLTAKAEQYQRQGNYQQACLCLYKAMLQSLAQRQIAQEQASRTDGEYWSLLKRLPRSSAYQTLLDIHQDLCFGGLIASSDTWEICQSAYQEIERK